VREIIEGEETNANMFVPIDLLKPILQSLKSTAGRIGSLVLVGVYAVEVAGRIYVTGVVEGGPLRAPTFEKATSSRSSSARVGTLPDFYRRVWAWAGGTGVSLTTMRGATQMHLNVRSVDRGDLLKRRKLTRLLSQCNAT